MIALIRQNGEVWATPFQLALVGIWDIKKTKKTRSPYNLRPITRECVHLVTRIPMDNNDRGHTMRSAKFAAGKLRGCMFFRTGERELYSPLK